MIEIKSNSLLGLLITCSVPLLFIVAIGLLARKRIMEIEQTKKELSKTSYIRHFDHRWMLIIGLISGLFILVCGTLAGFLLITYGNSASNQVASWTYLSLMTIIFFCGVATGGLLLIFIYKRNKPDR